MIKNSYILLCLLFFCFSCEKDESKAKGLFLKQIVYHRNVDQIGQYKYSNDGDLINYQYLFNGEIQDNEEYYYSNGKLDHTELYSRNLSSQPLSLYLTRSYEFDSNNNLVNFYESSYEFDYNYEFYYDGNIIDSIAYEITNNNFQETGRISYKFLTDNAGNIVKSILYNGTIDTINYEYDEKINPLFKLTVPTDFINYFAVNNVLKNYNSTFTYEYNSSDLPIKRHEEYNDHNGYTSTSDIEFIYSEL